MDPTPAVRASIPRDPALLPLILLAVLARILSCTDSPVLNSDGYFYLDAAAKFRSGDWPAALRTNLHPLYPFLIALLEFTGMSPRLCGLLLSLAAGAGAILVLYHITLDGWGREAARATAFLFALHPVFVGMEAKVMTEALYHLLAFGAVHCAWRALVSRDWRRGLGLGACLSGAHLTRSEGVLLILLVLGLTGALLLLPRFRPAWRAALLGLGVLSLLSAPYVLWIHQESGQWRPSPRGSYKRAIETGKFKTFDDSSAEIETRNRYGVAAASVVNVLRPWSRVYWMIPLALSGIGLLCFRKGASGGWRGLHLGLLALGNLAAIMLYYYFSLTHLSPRYVSLAAALLLPWAGWGFWNLNAWLLGRPWHPKFCAATFSVLIAAGLVARYLGPDQPDRAVVLEAAEWIRKEGGPNRRILASLDSVAYHAEGTFVWTESVDDVVRTIDLGQADYLVFLEDRIPGLKPGDWERITGRPGIHFGTRFGKTGRGVAIYEIAARR